MAKTRAVIHGMLLSVGGVCGAILLVFLISGCFPNGESGTLTKAAGIVHTEIILPHALTGTDLVIQNFVSYDGAEDVSEILAVVLENTGNEWISSCQVQITGNGSHFDFQASMLPPHSRTLVVESARSPYKKVEITDCNGIVNRMPKEWTRVMDVKIVPVDMGSIRLVNMGPDVYRQLGIYYKAYNQEAELYLEGIPQKEVVFDLQPLEERVICPAFYAGKYSRMLLIIEE